MNWRTILLYLFIGLLLGWNGRAGASESENTQLDETCASYTLSVVKPLLEHFEETKLKSAKHNVEMESGRINQLTKEISELRVELASYSSKDKMIELYESKVKTSVDQIEALKQELQLSSKCEQENNYEIEFKSQHELMVTRNKSIDDLEMEVKNVLEKLKGIEEKNARSCISFEHSSGVHDITLSGNTFEVLCSSDIAGSGWTVIQQRIKGGVNFRRDWNTYRNGFGDFWDGDFFLGLEKIHRLTSEQPHELYIHMETFDNSILFAKYDEFAISDEDGQYRLSKLGGFSGNTVDSLSYNTQMSFTTYDRDNDEYYENCAVSYHGGAGWWYKACTSCNLNGIYRETQVRNDTSIYWIAEKTLKIVKMMIRPKALSIPLYDMYVQVRPTSLPFEKQRQ